MSPFGDRPEMDYAVHTRTCTYLLDDGGVCRWVMSRQGAVPDHVQRCIGAQFVACLDVETPGGLLGDLRVGSHALFVHHEGTHMVLLRTGIIERVDDRGRQELPTQPPPAMPQREVPRSQYGKSAGVPLRPPPSFGEVHLAGDEATVTVSLPTAPTRPTRIE